MVICFSEQNYDIMQMIEDDIVKAQKAMKFKGIIEFVGKVCATSGGAGHTIYIVFSTCEYHFCSSYICWLANSFLIQ